MRTMHRRARILPALLLLVGLASGALVARLPGDFERTVVTPRNHGADTLLSAALLRFGVSSLVTSPARYFSPPILYPDPNPLRGTEPLVAQALLAVPFRLALGDRPAPVYTSARIVTLALVALATGLMLRELGARDSLCLAAGAVAVLVSTTAVFVDRIQAVSLQWLPLAILLSARYWRTWRRALLLPLALSAFLFVQASLYSTVMLLGLLPFLLPLGAALVARDGLRRAAGIALALAAAACLSLAVLWPYLRDRADVAAYATTAYAPVKSWNPAFTREAVVSPPEFGPESWPLRPHASWNGFFPGHAFLLLGLATIALARPWTARARGSSPSRLDLAFRACGVARLACGAGVLVVVALASRPGSSEAFRIIADALLWGALVAWSLRLAFWPKIEGARDEELARAASAFGLAAVVCLVLAHGSPIRLHHEADPVATGLFAPLSSLVAPLRELRELRRYLLPAGWAAVVALTLALERRLPARPRLLGPLLATAIVAVGLGERLVADTRKTFVPPPPAAYALLRESQGRGGLLELPVDTWAQITSIHRMLWQPSHGRPILAGRTGLDPAWYQPAREVLNEFPSRESLRLARAWGLDSVLDRRPLADAALPVDAGVVLRGERVEGRMGRFRLFDLLPAREGSGLGPEPQPAAGRWERPAWATVGPSAASAAIDGSLDTAAEVADPDGLSLVVPDGASLAAVELDYGLGRFSRFPPELRVLGLWDGTWVEMADDESRLELRARGANLLMRERRARLVVTLRPGPARRLRLVSSRLPWEVPEVRVRVAPSPVATGSHP